MSEGEVANDSGYRPIMPHTRSIYSGTHRASGTNTDQNWALTWPARSRENVGVELSQAGADHLPRPIPELA